MEEVHGCSDQSAASGWRPTLCGCVTYVHTHTHTQTWLEDDGADRTERRLELLTTLTVLKLLQSQRSETQTNVRKVGVDMQESRALVDLLSRCGTPVVMETTVVQSRLDFKKFHQLGKGDKPVSTSAMSMK